MNDKDYQNYVDLAKKELKAIETSQIQICKYASKVCTIRNGGGKGDYYTMKNFANDIGITPKALRQWMMAYRSVVQHLEKEISTTKEWNIARKVSRVLEEERTINRHINGTEKTKTDYNKPSDTDRINKLFNQLSNGEKPFEVEFTQRVIAAKKLKSALEANSPDKIPVQQFKELVTDHEYSKQLLDKRDLNIIPDEMLAYLMQILDNCSDKLNDFLTKKKKANGRAA